MSSSTLCADIFIVDVVKKWISVQFERVKYDRLDATRVGFKEERKSCNPLSSEIVWYVVLAVNSSKHVYYRFWPRNVLGGSLHLVLLRS